MDSLVTFPEIDNLPFCLTPNLDAQIVIEEFWRLNKQALAEKIQQMQGKEKLVEFYRERYKLPDLTVEDFERLLFEHEKAFVENVLRRLTEILNRANDGGVLDPEGKIFNIQATMLFDIDETIGGRLNGSDFAIRPVANLLFSFVREELRKIHIGIISIRAQKALDEQKTDPKDRYSINGIMEHVDAGVTGVNGLNGSFAGLQEVNVGAFDSSLYPNWQPENDLGYVLREKLGFSTEDAEVFVREQLPVFLKANMQYRINEQQQLHFQMEVAGMVRHIVRENEKSFPGNGMDYYDTLSFPLVEEICLCTQKMAEELDRDSEGDGVVFREGLVDEIMRVVLPELAGSSRELLRPAVDLGLKLSWDFLKKNRGGYFYPAPPEMVKKMDILENSSRREHEELIKAGGFSAFVSRCCYDENWEQLACGLQRRMMIDESGPLIMHKDFQLEFGAAVAGVLKENNEYKAQFHREVAGILGMHGELDDVRVWIVIQRLAACKRQIDSGQAQVAMAIDDSEAAKKMDLLLNGGIMGADGLPVDGYALFGLDDFYRGRIQVVHVGEMAEYKDKVFAERIRATLEA